MRQQKNVQIDIDLFCSLIEYFVAGEVNEFYYNEIRQALEQKIDKIIAHQKFSAYKTAPSGEERERLRREYLDHIGMFKSYRTDTEWHEPEPPDPAEK